MSDYVTFGELFDAMRVVRSKQSPTTVQKPPAQRPCLRIYMEKDARYVVSRRGQIYRLKQRHQTLPIGKLICSLFPQDLQVCFSHFFDRVSLLHGVGRCQKQQDIFLNEGGVVSVYSDFSICVHRARRTNERIKIY